MKTSSSLTLSGITGLVVVSFSALSALVAGPFSDPTILGFGALVIWALYEIAMVEKWTSEPVRGRARRPNPGPAESDCNPVVTFASAASSRRAA